MATLLIPDLVWDGRQALRDRAVLVEDGRIAAVDSPSVLSTPGSAPGPRRVPLPGRALLAAPVNAHSHAFQRAIRGRTQTRPAGDPRGDFWSWRREMYQAASALDPEGLHRVSRRCFAEMRAAGWGSVGEFHYLHRDAAGRPYEDPLLLSDAVIDAARCEGLPICLLYVVYETADVDGTPLRPEQLRFRSGDPDACLAAVEELTRRWRHDPGVTVGLAPHSVRAVPRSWWRPLAEGAERLDVPLHAHVAEQTGEVDACVAAHGRRPVEFLADEGVLSERFTAVHATHLTDGEVGLLADAGARVCACPSTERDLGDGVLPGHRLARAGVPVCLGSDSHTLLDPWEELRLPEYHLRLVERRRVVLGEVDGDRVRWAPGALRSATRVGGDALRTGAGRLEAGAPAALVTLDLTHPVLDGLEAEHFPEMVAVAARGDLASPVELD